MIGGRRLSRWGPVGARRSSAKLAGRESASSNRSHTQRARRQHALHCGAFLATWIIYISRRVAPSASLSLHLRELVQSCACVAAAFAQSAHARRRAPRVDQQRRRVCAPTSRARRKVNSKPLRRRRATESRRQDSSWPTRFSQVEAKQNKSSARQRRDLEINGQRRRFACRRRGETNWPTMEMGAAESEPNQLVE